MKKALLLATALVFGMTAMGARAEDHPMSSIKGTQIDLKSSDHAFAGSIKDFLVYGALNEETGSSALLIRQGGQTIATEFKKEGSQIGGTITQTFEDGSTKSTQILFKGLDKETATYSFSVNGAEMLVKVTAEGFEKDHFINPTYTAALNGETASFRLEGDACYGFSLHLSFMIFGAYFH